MKVEYLKTGRFMLVTDDGRDIEIGAADFWELARIADRIDARREIEEYLQDCCENIKGIEPEVLLANSAFIDEATERLIADRINNETLGQIWDILEYCVEHGEHKDEGYGKVVDDLLADSKERCKEKVYPYSEIANRLVLKGEDCDFNAQKNYGNFPTLAEIRRDYDALLALIKHVRTPEQAKALAEAQGLIVEINGESIDDFLADPLNEGVDIDCIRYESFGCLQYIYNWMDGGIQFDVWSNAMYREFITDCEIGDLNEDDYEKWISDEVKNLVSFGYADKDEVERLLEEACGRSSMVPGAACKGTGEGEPLLRG